MIRIELKGLTGGQRESWIALLQVAERIPDGWTLIGGQLVQLHCMERNRTPNRATNDVDTVLDIVSNSDILLSFTSTLKDLGFKPETYASGHQIKWRKADAEIDVLFPNAVGERTLRKTGISGGTTIETPGGRRVLDYSEKIRVFVDEKSAALINSAIGKLKMRPEILGSIEGSVEGVERLRTALEN